MLLGRRPTKQDRRNLLLSNYLPADLPVSAQAQDIWDETDADSPLWGGHAVDVPAVSPGLDVCNTWGGRKPMTPAFLDHRCAEAYAVLCNRYPPKCGLVDLDLIAHDLALLG